MAFQKALWFLMALFITFICSSHAYTFQVGGKDGWTSHPSENYNNWSGRMRFLINDSLHFKYDGGSDSVLVVNKGDYDGCNTDKPIMKLDGGDSTFQFDRSGPFYFISGNKSNCDQGQKLIVTVLSLRNKSPPSPSVTTPPSSSTLPPSPAVSPVLPPTPSTVSPVSPSPVSLSPVSLSPVSPPTAADSPESSPSGTPVLTPPASSPDRGSASSPSGGSASSPSGGSASSPSGGSASSPEGGSGSSRGRTGPGGGNNPAADTNSPRSAVAPPLSGAIIASFATMVVALWWFNY